MTIFLGILGIVLGLLLAYVVQFQLHFFGATMVTMDNIIELWLGLPLLLGALLVTVYSKRKE